jgi:hypothetical protein
MYAAFVMVFLVLYNVTQNGHCIKSTRNLRLDEANNELLTLGMKQLVCRGD